MSNPTPSNPTPANFARSNPTISRRSMSLRSVSKGTLGVLILPIGSLLCGCSSDTVDLGDGTSTSVVARGARCQDSTIITESVRVTNQSEMQALAGCDEIQGDLRIQFFESADLTPLSALRTVGGQLAIGASSTELFTDATGATIPGEETAWEFAAGGDSLVIQQGWLDSLAGLEGLERVGSLSIASTQLSTLEPLANLRNLNSPSFTTPSGGDPGSLLLQSNPTLLDLHGLESALGVRSVIIHDNDSLASLAGLNLVSGKLDSVAITTDHALTNIDALAPLTTLTTSLNLTGTSVENLDALAALQTVPDLQIVDNHKLVDAGGLSSLVSAQSFLYQGNALRALPSFANIKEADFRRLAIIGEQELETASFDFSSNATFAQALIGNRNVLLGAGVLEIGRNPKLRSISSSEGIGTMQALFVHDNEALSEIDGHNLQKLEVLWIDSNPNLTQLQLGGIDKLDDLEIMDNPMLSVSALANLPASYYRVYGNADGNLAAEGSSASAATDGTPDSAATP